jgi:hypothetical protein
MNATNLSDGYILAPALRLLAAAIVAAALLFALPGSPTAQSCNPVIDGTYCATQMPRPSTSLVQSSPIINPVSDFSSAFSMDNEPGTFAGISFQSNGTTCMGLLRRGACS